MNAAAESDRYYTLHFSRWPVWLLWKQLWRNVPLLAPLLFPILLLRTIPGLKPDPEFASVYPERLDPVPLESLPARARTALEARIREAEPLGFRLCFCFSLETLGSYDQHDAVLLDANGATLLQIRWYELRMANSTHQDTGVYCSSMLSAGGSLSSVAIAKRDVIPEMSLPDDQTRIYPETTPIEELVRLHREAIPDHARLHHDDCDSLLERFRERSKQLVDHLLERRIFFELTPQQIQKLQQQDAERERGA